MKSESTNRRRRAGGAVAGTAMLAWLFAGGAGVSLPAAGPPAETGAAPAGVGAGGQAGGTVADGVFTADQVSRGERTFRDVCSACHDTVEFSGGRFRFTWVGLTAGDLFDTIATLMPEGDPGSLSPAQYASVVAYLLDLNGYPAGETPLPTSLSALQALEIVEAP
ncbi:MAG: cytochrome c [Acidobacteria bacterium]|nr:cytochrome c [Acidobacteriota bacterium]